MDMGRQRGLADGAGQAFAFRSNAHWMSGRASPLLDLDSGETPAGWRFEALFCC